MKQEISVMIGVPTHSGDVSGAHMDSILKLYKACMGNPELGHLKLYVNRVRGGANIPRSRNVVVAEAARLKCTHVFFIDSDISFEVDDFLRFVHRPEGVICAGYQKRPTKWGEPAQMTFSWHEDGPVFDHDSDLIEIKLAPTGFLCIRMDVFKTLRAKKLVHQFCYQMKQNESWPYMYSYFMHAVNEHTVFSDEEREMMAAAHLPVDKRYQMDGEDYDFCMKLAAAGIPVMLDPIARVQHWQGPMELPVIPHHVLSGYDDYLPWLYARAARGDEMARAVADGLSEVRAELDDRAAATPEPKDGAQEAIIAAANGSLLGGTAAAAANERNNAQTS